MESLRWKIRGDGAGEADPVCEDQACAPVDGACLRDHPQGE
ncbi:hypothetical protein ATKI12_8450 [Kitasatospora sp. Ki12]